MNFRRSIIIADLWRSEVAKFGKFCEIFAFFEKTIPYRKIFEILSRKDSSRHWSMCCVQISWNLAYRKSIKSCVTYLTKKSLVLQLSLLRGSRPKSARASPDNVLRVLQISSKSVHFRWSYTRTREDRQNGPYKVNSIFGCRLASIFRNDCLETEIPFDSRIKVICGDYHHMLIIGSVCLCHGLSEH